MGEPITVDWEAIRREYVAGNGNMAALARKHGLAPSTLRKHAKRHDWGGERAAFCRDLSRSTYEKAREAALDHQQQVRTAVQGLELKFLAAAEYHIGRAKMCAEARDSMYHMTCAGIAIDKVRQQDELELKRAEHELRRRAAEVDQRATAQDPVVIAHMNRVAAMVNNAG